MPNDFLLGIVPRLHVRTVCFLNRGALDFLRGCEEPILRQPVVLHNNKKLESLMIVQGRVYLSEQLLKLGCNRILSAFFHCLGFSIIIQLQNCICHGKASPIHTRQFDPGVHDYLIFNWRWCNILAFTRLEDFLRPSCNLKSSIFVNLTPITRFEPSIFSHCLSSCFVILIIPHHSTRTLHLNFPVFSNALFDIVVGVTNITHPGFTGFAYMRIIKVFRHAVSFQQFKSKISVKLKQLHRKRCRTGTSETDFIQSKPLKNLFLYEAPKNRDAD
mmetsp:Transcript_13669/g.19961  ORF Transcript_13669/g.19961 Transcript_13669/m.19961 type:complete len:273 (+) Transcript_13669:308-1126(+)